MNIEDWRQRQYWNGVGS